MSHVSSIYIYSCGGLPQFNIEEVVDYIQEIYPKANIEKRDEFFSSLIKSESFTSLDNLAREITLCRVHKINEQASDFTPFPIEIDYEKKRLKSDKDRKGVIYDGLLIQNLCRQFIKPEELSLFSCHIIFSNQLISSFDENDKRYHLRTGIYGLPNLISTPGPIEALAKPREYYFKSQLGIDPATLGNEFKDDIIDYKDTRITELFKGYCLYALFYHLTGEGFCENRNCRLYNAHWQKEAVISQIENQGKLCPKHTGVITRWQNSQ